MCCQVTGRPGWQGWSYLVLSTPGWARIRNHGSRFNTKLPVLLWKILVDWNAIWFSCPCLLHGWGPFHFNSVDLCFPQFTSWIDWIEMDLAPTLVSCCVSYVGGPPETHSAPWDSDPGCQSLSGPEGLLHRALHPLLQPRPGDLD